MNFGAPWSFRCTPANYSHRSLNKCMLFVMYSCVLQLRKTSSDRYHSETNNTGLFIDSDKIEQIGSKLRELIFFQLLFYRTLTPLHFYFLLHTCTLFQIYISLHGYIFI